MGHCTRTSLFLQVFCYLACRSLFVLSLVHIELAKMPIRAARLHDLPPLSKILAEAFYDDELMGPVLHPHRQSFPQDYQRFWEHKVLEWYWDYSHQLNVTYYVKQNDKGHEEVLTGVGDWVRHGKGWEEYWGVWGKWDPREY